MLGEGHTLLDWNVQGLRELLDPVISLGLGFWVISIEDHNDALSFLHDARPDPVVLDVAYIIKKVPETSQNSMETRRLSTSASCSTILTELVGR